VRLEQYVRAESVLEAGYKRIPDSGDITFALARLLVLCPDTEVRDGERALELAQAVYTARRTPRHAQLMAQALAELDRCDEAAEWQQKVVDSAVEEGAAEFLESLEADLARYRRGSPCRVPAS
jgi:hypothetical protein